MNLFSTIGLRRAAGWGMGLVIVLGMGACDSSNSSDAAPCDPGVAVCQCTKKSDCPETDNCVNNQCIPAGATTQGPTTTSGTNTTVSVTASTSTGSGGSGAADTSGTGGAAGANGDTNSTGGTGGGGPPSVVLVLDRSTSAEVEFDDGLSRWEAIVAALTEEDGPLEQNAASVALGVMDYTGFQGGTCPAFGDGVDPASDNYAAVSEYIAGVELPEEEKSETPTREAIEQGASMFSAAGGGRKALILITDGESDDTCGTFDNPGCVSQAYYAAQQAYASGVRTYILAITNLQDGFLNGVANAGTGQAVDDDWLGPSCGPENEQPNTEEQGGNAPFWEAESTEEISTDLASIFDAILAN